MFGLMLQAERCGGRWDGDLEAFVWDDGVVAWVQHVGSFLTKRRGISLPLVREVPTNTLPGTILSKFRVTIGEGPHGQPE